MKLVNTSTCPLLPQCPGSGSPGTEATAAGGAASSHWRGRAGADTCYNHVLRQSHGGRGGADTDNVYI